MVTRIALMTVLFDYPENHLPIFYRNACKYFNKEDIHIVRHNGLIKSESYYDKLFFYKIVKLLEYIEMFILGKYDFILFLDATDTNFYTSPETIIEKFLNTGKSIIFCGEKGLWPPTNFEHLYNNKPKLTDSCYLNSGVYFGYVDKIIYYLKHIIENEKRDRRDDQGQWTIEYLLNNDIMVDQERKFFFSTYKSKEFVKIEDNKVELVGITPYVIHDNGPYTDDTIKLADILNK